MPEPHHVYMRPTVPNPTDSLIDDCKIVTGLLHRSMAARPKDTPSVVLASVREQCRRVFQVDWHCMELIIEPTED